MNVSVDGKMIVPPCLDFAKNKEKEKCNERLLELRLKLEARHTREIESAADALKNEICEASKTSRLQIQERTSYFVPFFDEIIKYIDKAETFEDVESRHHEKWHKLIDEWKSEIWDISKDLSVKCTRALVNYKKRLVNTKLYSVDVINVFIENCASEINKILICNQRDFLETETHLRKVYGVFVGVWQKKQAYMHIQAKKISKKKEYDETEEAKELTPHEQVKTTIADLIGATPRYSEVALPDTLMLSKLIVYLSHLGLCKEHIVFYFDLARDIVIEKAVDCTAGATESDLPNVEKLWTGAINVIKGQTEVAFKFVTEAIQYWNYFVVKIQKIECVTSGVLHRYRKNSSKIIIAFEEHLNVLFDKLREASDLLDLRVTCDQICSVFQNIEQTRRSMRNDEDKILNQSITAFFTMYDLFCADLIVLDQEINEIALKHKLPSQEIHELDTAQLCLTNAKNWFFGFRETMNFLGRETLSFLNDFLRNWLAYKKGESEFFLKLDLERLNQRKTRSVQNIVEVRWAELLEHVKAYEIVVSGIDVEFRLLAEKSLPLMDKLKDLDDELVRVLDSYTEQSHEGPLSVLYLNLIGKRYRDMYKAKKLKALKRFKEETARVCQWLKHLTVTFLKSVRFFGEGGNYSPEEADALMNKMKYVQNKIKKLGTRLNSKLGLIVSQPSEGSAPERELTMKELLSLARLQSQHVIDLRLDELRKRLDREIMNGRGVISVINELAKSAERGRNCESLQSIARIVGDSCYYFGLPDPPLQIDVERIIKKRKMQGFHRLIDFLSMSHLEGVHMSPKDAISSESVQMSNSEPATVHQEHKGTHQKGNTSKMVRLGTSFRKHRGHKSKMSKGSNQGAGTSDVVRSSLNETKRSDNCAYNFLYTMKKMILETHLEIKQIIERTYTVTYNIPEEYSEALAEEYLRKMRKINLNGEISWNALLLEFISSLLRVIQLLPDCANAELSNAFEQWNTKKKIRMDELENKIDSFNIEKEKKKIDAELKPWHGYTLNKAILQKLLRKVYNTCKDQLTWRKDVLENFQNEINEFWMDQNESKATLVQRTSEINNLIFVNSDVRRFVSNLYYYTSHFKRLDEPQLEEGNTPYLNCIKDYLNIVHMSMGESLEESTTQSPEEMFIEVEKFNFEELELISANVVQFLRNMKAIYRALSELIEGGYFPPAEEVTEEHEEEFVSVFFSEFQKKIESSHKLLKNEIKQSLAECKKEFDSANDNLQRWKDEWIYHVKNVIRLYSVDPILDGPRSSVKRLVNKINPRNAVPYNTPPIQ